jgi:hypothetical protein
MTKKERIIKNIMADKDVMKQINQNTYYTAEQFHSDCVRYIKAIKEGRVICSIGSVSSSGMSRTIKFLECSYNSSRKNYNYYNFYALFRTLGFTRAGTYKDYFRIGGCGMDMIFHTNYTIIHKLHRLGFIDKKQCSSLAQDTPTVI